MTTAQAAAFNGSMDGDVLGEVRREHAALVALLDRGEVLRSALALLAEDCAGVTWAAEPSSDEALRLRCVTGDRTDLLRGLLVPSGLGLTGKVYRCGRPEWVDDYFGSSAITHTFDQHIDAEGVRRLLAVPLVYDGAVLGVLAVGPRTDGRFGGRAVERATRVADRAALAAATAERARLAREVAVHEERRRMAAELHDSVGALLFAIGSGAAGLAETVDAAGDPELAGQLGRLREQAADAASALRASLRTLRASPSALALGVALQADCAAFADRTGVPAELVLLDDDPPALPPSRTEVLVTGVREALLNVEKHAVAGAVVVTVARHVVDGRDTVVVAVTDDGVGLPADHAPGLGLSATSDAVARLGGRLDVASDPQGGTTWRIRLPC